MKKFITRFLATLGFISLLPLLGLLAMAFVGGPSKPKVPATAVLSLDLGDNFPESPALKGFQQILSGPSTTFFELLRALSAAEIDPNIKGIAIRLNEPQIGLAQLEELREALLTFRKTGKFVMVYAETFGDLSPGTKRYYLASCADEIWMQPFSSLNLTGIHIDQPFFGAALKKLGIQPQILTRKEYKNAYATFTDEGASDANREATTSMITHLYNKMMGDITTGRELLETALKEITKNTPMMSDLDAQKLNFIDRLGYIDEFKEAVFKRAASEQDKNTPDTKLFSIHSYSTLVDDMTTPQEEKIALIYGVGAIMQNDKDGSGFGGQSYVMGADETRKNFEDALEDPQVKSIVFRIDSPGGSAVASETVRRMIHIAQEKGVPVVASFSNVAASGGYWFAAPCKKIIASTMTITGSIGALGGKVVFRDLLENYGVNISTMAVGENGSLWSPLTGYTDVQKKHMDRTMDLLYARFVQVVSEGRNLSLDHVSEVAKGRVWTGGEAKKLGLIDEIGGLRKAFDIAQNLGGISDKAPYEIVIYPQPKTLLENLQKTFSSDSSLSALWQGIRATAHHLRLMTSSEIKLLEPHHSYR